MTEEIAPPVPLTLIESHVISGYHYDHARKALMVRWQSSGGLGEYLNLPVEVYQQFEAEKSKGSFLLKKIKPNYEYKRFENGV